MVAELRLLAFGKAPSLRVALATTCASPEPCCQC